MHFQFSFLPQTSLYLRSRPPVPLNPTLPLPKAHLTPVPLFSKNSIQTHLHRNNRLLRPPSNHHIQHRGSPRGSQARQQAHGGRAALAGVPAAAPDDVGGQALRVPDDRPRRLRPRQAGDGSRYADASRRRGRDCVYARSEAGSTSVRAVGAALRARLRSTSRRRRIRVRTLCMRRGSRMRRRCCTGAFLFLGFDFNFFTSYMLHITDNPQFKRRLQPHPRDPRAGRGDGLRRDDHARPVLVEQRGARTPERTGRQRPEQPAPLPG